MTVKQLKAELDLYIDDREVYFFTHISGLEVGWKITKVNVPSKMNNVIGLYSIRLEEKPNDG